MAFGIGPVRYDSDKNSGALNVEENVKTLADTKDDKSVAKAYTDVTGLAAAVDKGRQGDSNKESWKKNKNDADKSGGMAYFCVGSEGVKDAPTSLEKALQCARFLWSCGKNIHVKSLFGSTSVLKSPKDWTAAAVRMVKYAYYLARKEIYSKNLESFKDLFNAKTPATWDKVTTVAVDDLNNKDKLKDGDGAKALKALNDFIGKLAEPDDKTCEAILKKMGTVKATETGTKLPDSDQICALFGTEEDKLGKEFAAAIAAVAAVK